jgi:histidyl-tRNA synthetase
MQAATLLRRAGASVEYALRKQQLGKQRKAALSANASYFVTLEAEHERTGAIRVDELLPAVPGAGGEGAGASRLMRCLVDRPSTLASLVDVLREQPGIIA